MRCIYLISNIDDYKTAVDDMADQNYENCVYYKNQLNNLGDNEHLYNNINSMREKLNRLLESGRIKGKDDMNYIICNGCIEPFTKLLQKPFEKRSIDEIIVAYESYINFNDTYTILFGGK